MIFGPPRSPLRMTLAGWVSVLLVVGCSSASTSMSPDAPAPSSAPVALSPTPDAPSASAGSTSPSPSASTASGVGAFSRISVPELRFDQSVIALSTKQMGNAIDPPKYTPGRPSGPVWIFDKGVQPAAGASDTTYVGCHTSVRNGPEKYPCDLLVRTVQPGMHLVVTTDAGPLTYTVTKTRSIPYASFAQDDETWRVEAKRLVFVVCDIVDGTPAHGNYVIYASLG